MPRVPKVNTKTAEKAAAPPPKRKAGTHPSDAEMLTRRRIMRGLMLVSSTPDQCLALMRSKFPDIDLAAVVRLYKEVEHELIERSIEPLSVKKAKQEARILGEIASASGKGAYSAVSSLEKTYADVAGTNAPVRIRHEVSFSERFNVAWQRAAAKLTTEQANGLLNGHTVPLGLGGGVIEVEGESSK